MAINISGRFEHNGRKYTFTCDVSTSIWEFMERGIDSWLIQMTDQEGNHFTAAWFYRNKSLLQSAKESIDFKLESEESVRRGK